MGKALATFGSALTGAGSNLPPGLVTLTGVPTLAPLPANSQGIVQVQVTIPYVPPLPLGTFSLLYIYLFAPDNITGDSILGGTGGTGPVGSPNAVMAGGFIIAADPSQYAVASSVSPASVAVLVDTVGYDPANLIITFAYPMPAAAQTWRMYAVSASATIQNSLVQADQPNATPNIAFVVDPNVIGSGGSSGVSGAEYAPNALTLALTPGSPYYLVDVGGQTGWQFGITWTNSTTDPLYQKLAGYNVILRAPNGTLTPLNTVQRAGGVNGTSQPEYFSPVLPVPPAEGSVYTIYLLPMDWNGNQNTLNSATAFTTITVSFPSGSAGEENASPVLNFDVDEVGYITNGSGQYVYRFVATWNPPNDPRFGGVHLFRITNVITAPGSDVSGQTQGVELGGGVQQYVMDFTDFPTLPTGVTWEFYALSCDTNNDLNTFQMGVTPTATLSVGTPPQGATGEEFTAVPTGLTVGSVSNGSSLTGQALDNFTASWTLPSDVRYGGVDVYYINPGVSTTDHYFIGRVASPGNTLKVSLPAPNSVQSWEIVLLAYDVNDNQNSYDPGVTPIVSVSVGTAGGTFDLKNTIPGSIGNGLKVTSSLLDVQTASGGGVGVGASGVNLAGFVSVGSSETFEGVAVVNGGTVAFLGSDGAGHNGIWALAFWAGGSGPANAPFYIDGSGDVQMNATLGGGDITITGGGSSTLTITGSGMTMANGMFTLNANGVTVSIENSSYGSGNGLAVTNNATPTTNSALTEYGLTVLTSPSGGFQIGQYTSFDIALQDTRSTGSAGISLSSGADGTISITVASGVPTVTIINAGGTVFNALTGSITIPKLTSGGTNGSISYVAGWITAVVAPT